MNFVSNIRKADYSAVRFDLHTLIGRHRLTSFIYQSEFSYSDSKLRYEDLTHELFLSLWSKSRFDYYVKSEMTDSEIKIQLSDIEIPNLLIPKIKKLKPEHFRLARRISTLVRTSNKFKSFGFKLALRHKHFGLAAWDSKPTRSLVEMEERIREVAVFKRDCRAKGRSGKTALIISTSDLEGLIISVLTAIDAVCSIEILRNLVLSKLPLLDVNLISIADSNYDDFDYEFEIADERLSVEENLMIEENLRSPEILVDEFLRKLTCEFKKNVEKQTNLLLKTLFYCYLSASKYSQNEVADRLGVSKSTISFLVNKIHTELQNLKIRSLEEADRFEIFLLNKIESLLGKTS